MHPYDIMLIISIACVIGFTAVIHVDDDLPLALGYVAAAVVGTPLGSVLFLRLVPIQNQFAVIIGGFVGGIALALAVRFVRHRWFPRGR